MTNSTIRFDDGKAYEQFMGKWSQLAGGTFLDWLAPKTGLRWLDVGCGNGAFTEMLVERCAPLSVEGIDPSEGQLAYARTRGIPNVAQFRIGDAMALPFADDAFDAAVMPLVIFFVPDPAKEASRMDAMRELWTRFGLSGIETREIIVQRTFANIDEYWATVRGGPSTTKGLATMSEQNLAILKTRMLQRLAPDATGRITCTARANAVKGRVVS
jgi:SAM-dependent methyltransferase